MKTQKEINKSMIKAIIPSVDDACPRYWDFDDKLKCLCGFNEDGERISSIYCGRHNDDDDDDDDN